MTRPKFSGRFDGDTERRERVDLNVAAIYRRWSDWHRATLDAMPADRRKFTEWEAEREARQLGERMSAEHDGRYYPELPAGFMADSEARWQTWGRNCLSRDEVRFAEQVRAVTEAAKGFDR